MQQSDNYPLGELEELVRQGERLMDGQIRATEEQDRKSQHWMTLSAAILATAAAVAGLNPGSLTGRPLLIFVGLLAVSLVLAGLAFERFSHAYAGTKKHESAFTLGWDPEILWVSAEEGDPIERIHRSTIFSFHKWFNENAVAMKRSARLRRIGRNLVISSGFALAIAFLFSIIADSGI